ncbi:MAG: hypothetical protein CSA81_03570 [Acidobacteria bacterium]|nr:MAG: hypothetical protein CSA81_03570 [Acidobacteriota bacterium]
MIPFNVKLKARILKLGNDRAHLGIYLNGHWHRIAARVDGILLEEKQWINGCFKRDSSGAILFTRIKNE